MAIVPERNSSSTERASEALLHALIEQLLAQQPILANCAFPILGPGDSVKYPPLLAQSDLDLGSAPDDAEESEPTWVRLAYGSCLGPNLVVVTGTGSASDLRAVLQKGTRTRARHGGVFAPHDLLGDSITADIVVDGTVLVAHGTQSSEGWSLFVECELGQQPLVIAIATHGYPLTEVALTQVSDVAPFFDDLEDRFRPWVEQLPWLISNPEDLDIPAATGLEGHHVLAEEYLAAHRSARSTKASGRAGKVRVGISDPYLWEPAIRSQMILRRQSRDEAKRALASSLSELQELDDLSWFHGDLERRATEETLAHVAYGQSVPSTAAHEAWMVYQQSLLAPSPRRAELPAGATEGRKRARAETNKRVARGRGDQIRQSERAWREAWRLWVVDASSDPEPTCP